MTATVPVTVPQPVQNGLRWWRVRAEHPASGALMTFGVQAPDGLQACERAKQFVPWQPAWLLEVHAEHT